MNLAILRCRAQYGTEAPPVTIEVFLSGGLPAFTIVGLAETAVRESKDRVRGALMSSGFEFPQQRITISLGPAEMRKTGGRYDLAIALGILAARRQFPADALQRVECYGELALSGDLRPVTGLLPAVIKAHEAGHRVIVPQANAAEAALAGAEVIGAASLRDVAEYLAGRKEITQESKAEPPRNERRGADLADVKGQLQARRALEIAAAGNHNLLFVGPPGTGKSMLARRLPGLLPKLSTSEALETAARRELREEVGYDAHELHHVSTYFTSKSIVQEIGHLYLGRRLFRVGAVPDETEFLEVATFPFEQVLQMVLDNEIRDSMTIITVLHAARLRDQ